MGQRNLVETNKKRKIALYWIKNSIGINSLSRILLGKMFLLITTIPKKMVKAVRDWLLTASDRKTIPSGSIIWERYQKFRQELPQIAQAFQLEVEELIFNDYTFVLAEWLKTQVNH